MNDMGRSVERFRILAVWVRLVAPKPIRLRKTVAPAQTVVARFHDDGFAEWPTLHWSLRRHTRASGAILSRLHDSELSSQHACHGYSHGQLREGREPRMRERYLLQKSTGVPGRRSIVCRLNEEKVVKPSRMPIVTKARPTGETSRGPSGPVSPVNNPMTREPSTLTVACPRERCCALLRQSRPTSRT
jgi:hypothetical protein